MGQRVAVNGLIGMSRSPTSFNCLQVQGALFSVLSRSEQPKVTVGFSLASAHGWGTNRSRVAERRTRVAVGFSPRLSTNQAGVAERRLTCRGWQRPSVAPRDAGSPRGQPWAESPRYRPPIAPRPNSKAIRVRSSCSHETCRFAKQFKAMGNSVASLPPSSGGEGRGEEADSQ